MKRFAQNTKECKGNPPSKGIFLRYSSKIRGITQGVTDFGKIEAFVGISLSNDLYANIFTRGGNLRRVFLNSTLKVSPYRGIP